jgi:pimeloyl-ACP methyl ester carboxylesterase
MAAMRGLSDGGRMTGLVMGTAMLSAAAIGGAGSASAQGSLSMPLPAQAPAKEGQAAIPDTRLFYWDTGGDGQPIVLLHPATGSALIWGYQQPAFAKAGLRVIGYSRRGYYGSAPFDRDRPGSGSVDLHHLTQALGIGRFHLVASAAGGSIAADFAFSHPDRLVSLTVSSNSLGVRDGAIAKAAQAIRPKGWDEMPADFRELGPSYRAANPEGVQRWIELEHKARLGSDYRQTLVNQISQAKLRELKVPTLLISGGADLSTPPSIARMIAAEIPNSRVVVAPEAGHSVYWEQPDIFNRAVLDLVAQSAR